MSDHPSIYQVAHMMTSEEHIKKDFEEIMKEIKSMIHGKYIGTLRSVIQDQHQQTKQNATKEVQLLEAIKPFITINQHPVIDQLVETMQAFHTIQSLKRDLQSYWFSSSPSIDHLYRKDGVYEVDEDCMRGNLLGTGNPRGDMIMLLAVVLLFKEL